MRTFFVFFVSLLLGMVTSMGSSQALVFPTNSSPDGVSGTFGPRQKASDGYRYDFHRGIDIPGTAGEDIKAARGGVVFRVYYECPDFDNCYHSYPRGGTVVIIKHTGGVPPGLRITNGFDYHFDNDTGLSSAVPRTSPIQEPINIYYTLYMHLQDVASSDQNNLHSESAPDLIQGSLITEGQVIGRMGDTGETTFTHLHFEVRVNTTCSIESQIAGQLAGATSCTTWYGYDPHINPFLFLAYTNAAKPTAQILTHDPLHVLVTSAGNDYDYDLIEVRETNGTTARIGFNKRENFDPTSVATLDACELTTEVGLVAVIPQRFSASTQTYKIHYIFKDLSTSEVDTVTVADMFGRKTILRSPWPPEQDLALEYEDLLLIYEAETECSNLSLYVQ